MLMRAIFINQSLIDTATIRITLNAPARWCELDRHRPADASGTPPQAQHAGAWTLDIAPGKIVGFATTAEAAIEIATPAIVTPFRTLDEPPGVKHPWPTPPQVQAPQAFGPMPAGEFSQRLNGFLLAACDQLK